MDAYTDFDHERTPPVREAEDRLRQLGARRHRRDPGMGVELDLRGEDHWALLREYASWSINVDVFACDRRLSTFHDCAHSISAALTDEQVRALGEELADLGRFVSFAELDAARKRARRARRRRWRSALRRRVLRRETAR